MFISWKWSCLLTFFLIILQSKWCWFEINDINHNSPPCEATGDFDATFVLCLSRPAQPIMQILKKEEEALQLIFVIHWHANVQNFTYKGNWHKTWQMQFFHHLVTLRRHLIQITHFHFAFEMQMRLEWILFPFIFIWLLIGWCWLEWATIT